ncbi:MAG: oligosaccharide flippase family protein, partial [Bacteroidia bacterium]
MLKKISKDFLLYTIGPQIPRIFSFLLLPVFTKYLTTTDYGISGIVYSYIGLFGALADLGLSIRYSITYFKYPKTYKNRWALLSGILFWWSLAFSFLQSFILFIMLPSDMGDAKLTVIILNFISNLLFASWNSLCTRYLQFKQASVQVATLSILSGTIAISLNYIFIVRLKLGFMGWFYSSFIISVFQGVFSLYWLFIYNRLKINFNIFHKSVLRILFITIPLVLHNYAGYLLDSSDRVVMAIFKINTAKIGIYNFAYIFALYFDFITTSVGIATGPMFAKLFFSKNEMRY